MCNWTLEFWGRNRELFGAVFGKFSGYRWFRRTYMLPSHLILLADDFLFIHVSGFGDLNCRIGAYIIAIS